MEKSILNEHQVSIYFNLMKIWIAHPELRFNQLVSNLQWEYNNRNDQCLLRDDIKTVDAFYLTDEKFAELLNDLIDDYS